MTERSDDRRAEDLRLAAAVTQLETKITAELEKAATIHASLAPIDHNHPQIQETVDQIVDILEGPEVKQPFGQPATRSDGLVDAVAQVQTVQTDLSKGIKEIKEGLANGGIKIRLPAAAWIAITIAIIAGVFQVAAAWVG